MAVNVGGLHIDLSADSASFKKDMAEAQKAVRSSSARMNKSLGSVERSFLSSSRASKKFSSGANSLKLALGGVLGGAGILAVTKASLNMADSIAKTADKLGVTTDMLQEMRYAAELTGVAQNNLDVGLQRFTRRASDAANGNKQLADTFDALGVSLRDGNGNMRSTDAILYDVADGLNGIDNQADKVAMTFKLFDSEGVALVNTLGNGSQALEGMRQEARNLGIVMEEDLLRQAERTNDQFSRMSHILKTRVASSIIEITPKIEQLAQRFIDSVPHIVEGTEAFLDFFGVLAPEKSQQLVMVNQELERTKAILSGGEWNGSMFDKSKEFFKSLGSDYEDTLKSQITSLEQEKARLEAAISQESKRSPLNVAVKTSVSSNNDEAIQQMMMKRSQMEAAANRVVSQVQTPQETFAARQTELNMLLEQGALSQEHYNRAMKQAEVDLQNQTDAVNSQEIAMSRLENAAGSTMDKALNGQIRSWKDLGVAAMGVLNDMMTAMAKAQAKAAIMKAVSSSSGDSGGFFASMFSSGQAHSGALIGSDKMKGHAPVSASVFSGAPKFHTGGMPGLKHNEVPAILEKGEGVFTQGQMKALGVEMNKGSNTPSKIIINVNNMAEGTKATAESKQENGVNMIDILIEKVTSKMSDDIGRNKGLYGALESKFAKTSGGLR